MSYGDLQAMGMAGTPGPLDGGETHQSFDPQRRFTFKPHNDVSIGRFDLRPDGRICIDTAGAMRDCDLYLRDGELRFRVGETRGRTPFRLELGLSQ